MSNNNHTTLAVMANELITISVAQTDATDGLLAFVAPGEMTERTVRAFRIAYPSAEILVTGSGSCAVIHSEQDVTALLADQRQGWNDEATQAIKAIDPSAASVVRATRGFEFLGRPSRIQAWLADGSRWDIEDGKARKLTGDEVLEEVSENLRALEYFA